MMSNNYRIPIAMHANLEVLVDKLRSMSAAAERAVSATEDDDANLAIGKLANFDQDIQTVQALYDVVIALHKEV